MTPMHLESINNSAEVSRARLLMFDTVWGARWFYEDHVLRRVAMLYSYIHIP